MNSIRKRIIGFLIVSLTVINITSGYYIYSYTYSEIDELFSAEQAQVARTISSIISNASIPDTQNPLVSQVPLLDESEITVASGHHYESKIAYQVWDLEGNLLLMSENAPLYPFAATAPGFSETTYDGNRWHIFSLYSNTSKNWIYTAQHDDARKELMTYLAQDYIIMMLLVNMLVLFIVVVGVVYGTRPIAKLSSELAQRGGANLAPIELEFSRELIPIKNGINNLLERIEDALTQERSFNADLSHELRTPLAAIKVYAQNIELKEDLSKDGLLSLNRMVFGIDVMSQAIEQLLLLNRIDSEHQKLSNEEVALHNLVQEVLSLLPAAVHQKHEIELQSETIFVRGNKSLLSILVRNLVENADKYSEVNTPILVVLKIVDDKALIEVIDSGPGMTEQQKVNAIKRRYRVSDSQSYGSGLGLSIVAKIVELHNGQLSFIDRESMDGLVVRVSLPMISILK